MKPDYQCEGQLSIFDLTPKKIKPGEWLETHGKEMTFDEITQSIGQMILMDHSTQSHKWYKAVIVEQIVNTAEGRRLVYFDGSKQRGLVNERYFYNDYGGWKSRAYRLPT